MPWLQLDIENMTKLNDEIEGLPGKLRFEKYLHFYSQKLLKIDFFFSFFFWITFKFIYYVFIYHMYVYIYIYIL